MSNSHLKVVGCPVVFNSISLKIVRVDVAAAVQDALDPDSVIEDSEEEVYRP